MKLLKAALENIRLRADIEALLEGWIEGTITLESEGNDPGVMRNGRA